MSEYLAAVDDFFANNDNFVGRANILGAFRNSIDVFNRSNHYNSNTTKRIAVLITANNPTITPEEDLYGPNPCQPEYNLNTIFQDLDIYLYAALVEPAISSTYACFQPDATLIEVINSTDLQSHTKHIVGQLQCPSAILSYVISSIPVVSTWKLLITPFAKNHQSSIFSGGSHHYAIIKSNRRYVAVSIFCWERYQ